MSRRKTQGKSGANRRSRPPNGECNLWVIGVFAPLFRILSLFLVGIGLLAATTGAYSLIFRADFGRFVTLMLIGIAVGLVGYRLRLRSGELDYVVMRPDAIANHFEIAKALGLGANASRAVTATAGALAGATIVAAVGLAGFITPGALLAAVILFAFYGAVLALVKKEALRRGALVKSGDGYYGSYRRVSQYVVPVIVVTWLIASAPEANPVTLGLIVIGLLFWVGKAFHYVWEVTHIAILTLIYGEHRPQTIEWGLYQWLRLSRRDVDLISVTFHPEYAEAEVVGRFYRPAELEREMRRLDFLKSVKLISADPPATTGVR